MSRWRPVAPSLRGTPERAWQVGFLVLLAVCALQVGWWVYDEYRYTRGVRDRIIAGYERDLVAAQHFVADGIDREALARVYPHLVRNEAGALRVDPELVRAIDAERARRINRFVWESVFFLVVLIGGIAVLARALRQDAELRRRQQNFLAAVSHEFKSPLASVRLAVETLALREPARPLRQRLQNRILGDLDRLDVMVSNILNTSQLEEGRVRLEPSTMNLAETFAQVLDDVAPHASGAGVEIGVDIDEAITVRADAQAIRTVFRNLLDNAVKAAAAKSPPGRVDVHARYQGAHAIAEIVDTGCGFLPSEAAKLFDKFYRPGDEMRRTSRGSGLGLYIVKRLVELHGGRVVARSDGPGRGSVFAVSLPSGPGRES